MVRGEGLGSYVQHYWQKHSHHLKNAEIVAFCLFIFLPFHTHGLSFRPPTLVYSFLSLFPRFSLRLVSFCRYFSFIFSLDLMFLPVFRIPRSHNSSFWASRIWNYLYGKTLISTGL
jgi:hypothetical protein